MLVELVRKKQAWDEKLITPGTQIKWSGVALPPWLPRSFAEPILNKAKETLQARIGFLFEVFRDNVLKRSPSLSPESALGNEFSPPASPEVKRTRNDSYEISSVHLLESGRLETNKDET
jgi:hypothetical protein